MAAVMSDYQPNYHPQFRSDVIHDEFDSTTDFTFSSYWERNKIYLLALSLSISVFILLAAAVSSESDAHRWDWLADNPRRSVQVRENSPSRRIGFVMASVRDPNFCPGSPVASAA